MKAWLEDRLCDIRSLFAGPPKIWNYQSYQEWADDAALYVPLHRRITQSCHNTLIRMARRVRND